MEIYKNPSNHLDIKSQIENSNDHLEISNIIKETFPTWIRFFGQKYSSDYPHLQRNWELICTSMNVSPMDIILVDYISFNDPDYSLLE